MRADSQGLRKSPLNGAIRRLGAKCVNYAGWDMPVQFQSVIEEHLAVRIRAGLFDVSHMGEISVAGKNAFSLLQRLTPNDISRLSIGQAHYSALLTTRGTFIDDILIYRRGEERYLLCVNATNTEKDYRWIRENANGEVVVKDVSTSYAQLALQGPRSVQILSKVAGQTVGGIPSYHFVEREFAGIPMILSRTGYTGEDGFEMYFPPREAERFWTTLLEAGKEFGLVPVGLAARDTLRLEARLPLYGNDIDDTVTPLEAGLGFIVSRDKEEFVGREVLVRQREEGVQKKLIGFELSERGIARSGCPLEVGERELGRVTSGTFAPFLKRSIGLGYLPVEAGQVGQEIRVVIRDKKVRGRVVKTPFYKRQS